MGLGCRKSLDSPQHAAVADSAHCCRRSAVERQACSTLGALASALGPRFQAAALHLMPHLFRALVLSIQVRCSEATHAQDLQNVHNLGDASAELGVAQVMAQAAEACAQVLATACTSVPLVSLLCSRLVEDRSAKLRCSCCHLLAQVHFAGGIADPVALLLFVSSLKKCSCSVSLAAVNG